MELQNNQKETSQTTPKKKKFTKRVIIVLVFLLLLILFNFLSLRGSYLEIKEIGENYLGVFWQNLRYEYITMAVLFVVLFFAIYFTNRGIKKGLKMFFDDEKREEPKLPNKSIAFILAALISILTAKLVANQIMLFINTAQFGIPDPIFSQDIGYFIFQKPFIELVIVSLIGLVLGLAIYTALYYIIAFNVFFDGVNRETLKKSQFIKQITRLIKIVIILFAGFVLVKIQDIVYERFITLKNTQISYYLNGAGLADTTIKLWGYVILSVIMVISVFLAIRFFNKGQTKKVIISILTVPGYLVGLLVVLMIFNLMFIKPNELDKQKEYIQYNIDSTKNAYNINAEEISIQDNGTITSKEIEEYADVLNNIPIVNEEVTLKELNNSQTNKGYYTYTSTQIGKYEIDGQDKIVYVTPREILTNERGRTYNNKTYEYTHGYGAILSSAVTTNDAGNLSYIQKSLSEEDSKIEITQPRIYFGTQTNNTVVTNTTNKKEFDYPILNSKNAENAENTYDGTAGLNLNFFDRFVLGLKVGDINLAFSGNVNSQSKILTNRNIIERAKKVMPYLMYDENPYLVITEEGKLVWVLDAYTVSNQYPYSQRTTITHNGSKQEINYIRNSVKVLIDAYDGTVDFYITDRNDPIIMAYQKAYQGLFKDKEETIPQDIAKHFVYPEFLYEIQADILARYHNVQPDVLYREDDVWTIGTHNSTKVATKTGTPIEPYYTMIKLENQQDTTLGLILPYTPLGKQNLISYLVGTYEEGSSAAKLQLYKYNADTNILGPMQLDTQLDQDDQIAQEIASLNVSGTKMVRNIMMVPLGNTILYVEPIYQIYLNESDVPVLKKIVVASGNKVAIGNNLREALTNLLSQYAGSIEIENTDDIEGLIEAIIKANNNLTASNTNNDWELIGKDMKKLQELINKLEQLKKEEEEANQINTNITGNQINPNEVNQNSYITNVLE